MSKVHEHFDGRQPSQAAMDAYIKAKGGTIIKTFRDTIFTDEAVNVDGIDMDKIIVLDQPLVDGEFVDRVELNPNFIVSVTTVKPQGKIITK